MVKKSKQRLEDSGHPLTAATHKTDKYLVAEI